MNGAEFRTHRTSAQLSVRKAAEVLAVAPSAIQRWEKGQSSIPSTAADRIRSLGLQMIEHTDPEMAVAHVLGRLCGVLEYVAGTEPDTWRRMGVAESPATGFVILMQLAAQPENGHRRQERDAEIEQLMARVPSAAFPPQLTPEQEGQFWIGYYHWRLDQRSERQRLRVLS